MLAGLPEQDATGRGAGVLELTIMQPLAFRCPVQCLLRWEVTWPRRASSVTAHNRVSSHKARQRPMPSMIDVLWRCWTVVASVGNKKGSFTSNWSRKPPEGGFDGGVVISVMALERCRGC